MIKTITVSPKITAAQFGCNTDHFMQYIKDKKLLLISETREFVTVRDEADEEWTVSKQDLKEREYSA